MATESLLEANNAMLASAYSLNVNMRNNNLELVPDLFYKFYLEDAELFNTRYTTYIQTLSYTGNSVELLIFAAIAGMVSFLFSKMFAGVLIEGGF